MMIDRSKDSLPYEEGKNLTLIVNQALPEEESSIEVKIVRFIQPAALSCGLVSWKSKTLVPLVQRSTQGIQF